MGQEKKFKHSTRRHILVEWLNLKDWDFFKHSGRERDILKKQGATRRPPGSGAAVSNARKQGRKKEREREREAPRAGLCSREQAVTVCFTQSPAGGGS